MNTHTEFDLDAMKAAFQRIDTQMAKQHQLQLKHEQQRGIARMQWRMWPLWFGQSLQMLFGLLCIVLGAAVWSHLRDGSAMFYSAIIVHAYGVICIVLGGITLGKLAAIDRADALITTQLKLARLRRLYILGGMTIGLAWWLFWIPFMATLFFWLSAGRVDFLANMGSAIAIMIAVGSTGLVASLWFHRWSRSPKRPRLAKAMEAAVTGHSLARAQQRLDALRAFSEE